MKGHRITVLGGGIGGMAAAAALAQHGADVRVLERSPVLAEVGAGIQVSPNGVAVLDALGIDRGIGLTAQAVVLRDGPSGRKVARLPVAGGARPYLLCHRANLLQSLADRAGALGTQVELGQTAVAVRDGPTGGEVQMAGGDVNTAPLVVGADGLHSVARQGLNGNDSPFFTGQVAWRAVVPGSVAPEATVFMGPGRHLVRYPLPGGQINLVGVEERDGWAPEGWSHPDAPENFRHAFRGFCDEVQTLLDSVKTTNLWGLFRHPPAQKWHGQSVALVGDAAHPTLPFLAQGANLALEDAWVLADALAQNDPAQALPLYQERRHARVVRAIEAANGNARNYHHANPLARVLGHSALRLLSAAAPGVLLSRFDWLYGHDVTA